MIKHTPGRLTYSAKLSGSENHRGFRIFNAEGFAIAEVQPLDQDGVRGEVYARKFVAVDDLLAALSNYCAATNYRAASIASNALDRMGHANEMFWRAHDAAIAAIAKATHGEPT